MTYEEARDIVAQKWGLSDFERLRMQGRPDMESFYEAVAELYAKWCREDEMNRWKKTIYDQRILLSKSQEPKQ